MAVFITIFTILISFTSCTGHMESRIVGGHFTKIEYFPHAVYLWVTESDENWICGASILNQRLLLTAAHCVDECVTRWTVKAYAGSDTVSKMKLVRYVARYIVHRNYDPRRTVNDIALTFLASSLPLGQYIKRVIIKNGFDNVQVAQVAGWGMVNDETEEDTDVLKSVQQNLQSTTVCKKVGEFVSGMMCFSNSIKSRPSKGDSGSALIYKGQQIGLVSFRHPLMPELVVYTNVSFYYSWITSCARPDYEKWNVKASSATEIIDKVKVLRKVIKYVIHPGYDYEHHINNIGLANLMRPLLLGVNVQRVSIKPTFENVVNAVIASFGSSSGLTTMRQTIQDEDNYKEVYDEMGVPTTTGMFCAMDDTKDPINK